MEYEIYVDYREPRVIFDAISKCAHKWSENFKMTTGDFAIMNGENVCVIFERKTWNDLSSSIIDGRADKQCERLVEFKNMGTPVIYLIEGDPRAKRDHGVNRKALRSYLAKIALQGISILYSKGPSETIKNIDAVLRALPKTGGNVVASSEMLYKKTVRDDSSILVDAWQSLPGIGKVTAVILVESGITLYKFFMGTITEGDLEGIKCTTKIRGYLLKPNKEDYWKPLSAFPGISKKTAMGIVTHGDRDQFVNQLIAGKKKTKVLERAWDLINVTGKAS